MIHMSVVYISHYIINFDTWCLVVGTLMFLDAFMERGLHTAHLRWGDKTQCHFPLFNFMAPLPLEWMYIVYLAIMTGW